jgi:hypothetical protein
MQLGGRGRKSHSIRFTDISHLPNSNCSSSIPTVVLTRADGGYDNNLDVSSEQMERERKEGQAMLARLSTNSSQIFFSCGHNLELEAPAAWPMQFTRWLMPRGIRGGSMNLIGITPHLIDAQPD